MTEPAKLEDYGDAAAMLAVVSVCDCLLADKLDQAKEVLAQLDDTVFARVAEIARELRWVTMVVKHTPG